MRIYDLHYLSEIPDVKLDKVGSLLNTGVHHRVYRYGRQQVIKVPRQRFTFLYSERAHLEADLAIIDQHFPHFRVKTEVYASANHQRHCIVQERLSNYRLLTPERFVQHRDEFNHLWQKNHQLITQTGRSLDFIGGEGLSSCMTSLLPASPPPFFSNILIDETGKKPRLRLIDTELLYLGTPEKNHADILRWGLSWISWLCTLFCLEKFFGVKDLK
jgi:hypothetical protein